MHGRRSVLAMTRGEPVTFELSGEIDGDGRPVLRLRDGQLTQARIPEGY